MNCLHKGLSIPWANTQITMIVQSFLQAPYCRAGQASICILMGLKRGLTIKYDSHIYRISIKIIGYPSRKTSLPRKNENTRKALFGAF